MIVHLGEMKPLCPLTLSHPISTPSAPLLYASTFPLYSIQRFLSHNTTWYSYFTSLFCYSTTIYYSILHYYPIPYHTIPCYAMLCYATIPCLKNEKKTDMQTKKIHFRCVQINGNECSFFLMYRNKSMHTNTL